MFGWFFTLGDSFASVAGLAFGISLGLLAEVAMSFWLLSKKTGLWTYAHDVQEPLKSIKTLLGSALITFLASYGMYRITDIGFNTTKTIGVLAVASITALVCAVVYGITARNVFASYIDFGKIKARIARLFESKN